MPCLSVIIPTYNYGHFILKAIHSVLGQNHQDFELIIVDDGSKDQTDCIVQSVMEKYPHSVRYVKQENQGAGVARNRGAAMARGKYLLFLDADDELMPNALENFANAIVNDPHCVIARYLSVSPDGEEKLKKRVVITHQPEENFKNYLRKKIDIAQGAFIVKKTVFEKISYPSWKGGREDLVFFGQLLANFPVQTLDVVVLKTYRHADSLRHQSQFEEPGFKVSEALFQKNKMPMSCLKYKKELESQLRLSYSRQFFLAHHNKEGRYWYYEAIKNDPRLILRWTYLKYFLRSF